MEPDFTAHILGNIVSQLVPPEGGVLLLTDLGYIYAFGNAQYHGAVGGNKDAGWGPDSNRRGAQLRAPNPNDPRMPGPHYVIIDTADETYNF